MARKIIITLDPGHGYNVNQGVVKAYYESNVVYDLALKLKGYLEATGIFTVYLTKNSIKDDPSLARRGQIAINNKSTVFLSLHSNAATAEYVTYLVCLNSVRRRNTAAFVKKFGDTVTDFLATVMGKCDKHDVIHQTQSNGDDWYGVLRSANKGPLIQYDFLIEHSFHTNRSLCNALLVNSNVDKIARMECDMLYEELKKYYVDPSIPTVTGKAKAAVNIRPNPNTNDPALGTLAGGASIPVVCKTANNWYQVIYNDRAAYIDASYLTVGNVPAQSSVKYVYPPYKGAGTGTATPEPQTPAEDISKWIVVPGVSAKTTANAGLNIRQEPSTAAKILGTLSAGTKVGILAPKATDTEYVHTYNSMRWYAIYYQLPGASEYGKGWASADYIQLYWENCPTAIVNTGNDTLNYRVSPSLKGKIAGSLKSGTVVYTLGSAGIADNISWTKIALEKNATAVYYCASTYLVQQLPSKPEDVAQIYMSAGFVKATGSIFSAPERLDEVQEAPYKIAEVANRILPYVGKVGSEWVQVIYDGAYGYIKTAQTSVITEPNTLFTAKGDSSIPSDLADELAQRMEGDADKWFTTTLGATVISRYGAVTDPATGTDTFHSGVDYGAPNGTVIYANIPGIVIAAAEDDTAGNYVTILDQLGREHHYTHLGENASVAIGEIVLPGMPIGKIGSSGNANTPHLHYGVKLTGSNGSWIDPNSLNYQY